jgi:hypothetical protein
VAPLPPASSQRRNVLFGQTLPFAVKVHPLIVANAATLSIDFDPRVITYVAAFRVILGYMRGSYKSRLVTSGWSLSALPPKADIRERIQYFCLCHKRTSSMSCFVTAKWGIMIGRHSRD